MKTKAGYLATKWMPYECSLVAAGADPAAGLGREFKTLEVVKMDKNDLLMERKKATDKMIEMAGKADLSSEDKETFDRIKDAVEGYDRRLEVLDDIEKVKKPEFRVPDAGKKRDLSFKGGPAHDRSFAGMFGEPEYSEDEMRAFRDTMTEGIPSGGGFSVPDPLSAKWLDAALPEEVIRPRATVWPMESSSRKIPGWDTADMSDGSIFGGFTMGWTNEGGTFSKQVGKMRAIELVAKKAGIFCDISSELFEDGLGFPAQLEMALKKSISYGLEAAFTTGTGAGMPKGLTNDAALISITKETGQSADSVCFENIAKAYAQMYAGGRRKGVWLANDTTLPQLLTGLTIAIGTAGAWVNVFSEKDSKFTLLGRPVVFTPHLPTLGDANDLMFVDLSQYSIGMRKEMRIERSPIPSWTEDLMSYRILIRADAQGTWKSAYSPKNGDDQSWIVGLGERA